MKVYCIDAGEKEYVIAEDEASARECLKEFYGDDIEDSAEIKTLSDEDLQTHKIYTPHEDCNEEDIEQTFAEAIEELKKDPNFELPIYFCSSAF